MPKAQTKNSNVKKPRSSRPKRKTGPPIRYGREASKTNPFDEPDASDDSRNSHSEKAVTTTPAPSRQGALPSKHSCAIRGTTQELHRPAWSIRLAGGHDPWTGAPSTPGIDENGAMKGQLMKMTMITADVAGRGGTDDLKNTCVMLLMRADASGSGGAVNANARPRPLPIPAFCHRRVSMIVSLTVIPSQVIRNHLVTRMSRTCH